MPLTWFDFVVFTFIATSGFLAMVRGFSREVITVLSWSGALYLTVVFSPYVTVYVDTLLPNPLLSKIFSMLCLFTLAFLLISVLSAYLIRTLLNPEVGVVDKSFGLFFGCVRGLFIVGVGYLLFSTLVPHKNYPAAIRDAQTYPLLSATAQLIFQMLPSPEALGYKRAEKAALADSSASNRESEGAKKAGTKETPGYPDAQRQGLNQLLEGANSQKGKLRRKEP